MRFHRTTSLSKKCYRGIYIPFVFTCLCLFPQISAAVSVTGFGGALFHDITSPTAGIAISLFMLAEGEYGVMWDDADEETASYASLNMRLPVFTMVPELELERRYWWILPYFESGLGIFAERFSITAGIGVNLLMKIRLDYRYMFVVDDHDHLNRIYLGIEVPLGGL